MGKCVAGILLTVHACCADTEPLIRAVAREYTKGLLQKTSVQLEPSISYRIQVEICYSGVSWWVNSEIGYSPLFRRAKHVLNVRINGFAVLRLIVRFQTEP